jgi:hypothetical protein
MNFTSCFQLPTVKGRGREFEQEWGGTKQDID